ncbi:MAG: hypothetical protein ACJARZ_000724 [Dokdonia sp.]|jgi:hypothetical protein
MTLHEAYNFFEGLINQTTKKLDLKVYDQFLYNLSQLKLRTFSKEEIQTIETALENLDLKSNPENKRKYFKKALTTFEAHLKDTFSLTPKGHYTNLYSAKGLPFGLLFGVAILSNLGSSLGIALGLIGGVVIGSLMGRQKDAEVKAIGKML